jgi:hypothetical protein
LKTNLGSLFTSYITVFKTLPQFIYIGRIKINGNAGKMGLFINISIYYQYIKHAGKCGSSLSKLAFSFKSEPGIYKILFRSSGRETDQRQTLSVHEIQ